MQSIQRPGLSPALLFESVDVPISASVPWGTKPVTTRPGAYVLSLHSDPERGDGLFAADMDGSAIERWLDRVPHLRLTGERPSAEDLATHMSRWWLPDTLVLYIGKASNLKTRVGAYYKTPLGDRRPHHGGYWIKVLTGLASIHVHYAMSEGWGTHEALEDALLDTFVKEYGSAPRHHPEPGLLLPWANLTKDRPAPRHRRQHGIHPSALQDRLN